MIRYVTVHARRYRGKSAFSGCRDTEGRACDTAIAFLEGSLDRSIDGSFRLLWMGWTVMPTTIKGERCHANAIGATIMVGKIATGEISRTVPEEPKDDNFNTGFSQTGKESC